jgi:Flp pilus assembly protein TadD
VRILLALLLLAPSLCRAADTIAVLPLFNLDENKASNLDWIGESVAETIRETLVGGGLLVLPREDREEVYRRLSLRTAVVLTKASVLKIGEALDAGQIVFGELHVDGADAPATNLPAVNLKANLHIALHVIDLKKLQEGPGFTEDGPLENLSQMETHVAWMILHRLAPASAPSEETFLHDRAPVRVEAMENYVRGLMASNTEQKTRLFTQAAKLDEHFSQPNFQLGRLAFARKDYKTAVQWLAKVTKGDSHFLEAAFLRGICKYHGGDFDAAADQFRMVANEIPLNEVFNNLGAALSRRNDAAATENFNKALEGDQADPDYWFNVGYSLWKQGKFELAAANFRAVLDRSPSDQDATTMLGYCLKMEGPRAGDPRSDGRERLKTTFEDSAFRQLQAELKSSQ